MAWLRLVGSLKLQVSFAEHRLFHRALLQMRPIILRSLLIVATPYGEQNARYLPQIDSKSAWYSACCSELQQVVVRNVHHYYGEQNARHLPQILSHGGVQQWRARGG